MSGNNAVISTQQSVDFIYRKVGELFIELQTVKQNLTNTVKNHNDQIDEIRLNFQELVDGKEKLSLKYDNLKEEYDELLASNEVLQNDFKESQEKLKDLTNLVSPGSFDLSDGTLPVLEEKIDSDDSESSECDSSECETCDVANETCGEPCLEHDLNEYGVPHSDMVELTKKLGDSTDVEFIMNTLNEFCKEKGYLIHTQETENSVEYKVVSKQWALDNIQTREQPSFEDEMEEDIIEEEPSKDIPQFLGTHLEIMEEGTNIDITPTAEQDDSEVIFGKSLLDDSLENLMSGT